MLRWARVRKLRTSLRALPAASARSRECWIFAMRALVAAAGSLGAGGAAATVGRAGVAALVMVAEVRVALEPCAEALGPLLEGGTAAATGVFAKCSSWSQKGQIFQ